MKSSLKDLWWYTIIIRIRTIGISIHMSKWVSWFIHEHGGETHPGWLRKKLNIYFEYYDDWSIAAIETMSRADLIAFYDRAWENVIL